LISQIYKKSQQLFGLLSLYDYFYTAEKDETYQRFIKRGVNQRLWIAAHTDHKSKNRRKHEKHQHLKRNPVRTDLGH